VAFSSILDEAPPPGMTIVDPIGEWRSPVRKVSTSATLDDGRWP
jgi:hypothetical protein